MLTAQQITQIAEKHPGADRKVVYRKDLKIKSTFLKKNPEFQGFKVEKESVFYVRFVEYGNQKSVKEAKENGRADCPNNWTRLGRGLYLDDKGQLKISVAPSALKLPRSRKYFLNGQEIELDKIKEMLYAGDYKDQESPDWFTLKQENIKELHSVLA